MFLAQTKTHRALTLLLATSLLAPAAGAASDFCPRRLSGHRNALNPVLESLGDGTFAAIWRDSAPESFALAYARLDGEGALLTGPSFVTDRFENLIGLSLAAGGGRVGVSWLQRQGNSNGLFFRLLDPAGQPLTGPLRLDRGVDPVGPTMGAQSVGANFQKRGGLAWDGAGWGSAFNVFNNPDDPGDPLPAENVEVQYVHVAGNGRTSSLPVEIDDTSAPAYEPRLVWNGTDFGVVWIDERSGSPQLRYRRLGRDGVPLGPSVALTTTASLFHFDLAWNGSEYGLVWNDDRDGDFALFFLRFDLAGAPLSAETRLSDPPDVSAFNPVLRWLGDRWAVAVDDSRPALEIWLSFADEDGAKLGPDVRVSSDDTPFGDYPALAASGGELLVAWHAAGAPDSLEIHSQALDATGDPGSHPHRILTGGHSPGSGVSNQDPSGVVATAAGHAIVVADFRGAGDGPDPRLYLTDQDGASLGSVPVPDTPNAGSFQASVATSASTLAVLWSGTGGVVLSRFTVNGVKLGSDLVLAASGVSLGQPLAVAWNGSAFVAAWVDRRDGNQEIYTASIEDDGTVLSAANRISNDTATSQQPTLAPDGSLIVWVDFRGAAAELWGATLGPLGQRVGSEIAVTSNDGVGSVRPHLGASSSELGLVWHDQTPQTQVFFRRLTRAGVLLGAPLELSGTFGSFARVAWGGDRWAVTYNGVAGVYRVELGAAGSLLEGERVILRAPQMNRRAALDWDGENFIVAFGRGVYFDGELHLSSLVCLVDDTPPTCPASLTATIDGPDVELVWPPGFDLDSGVQWQHVTRNGLRIAGLGGSATSYVDRQAPHGQLTYRVTPINYGLAEAANCPSAAVTLSLFADGFESGSTSAWSATVPP